MEYTEKSKNWAQGFSKGASGQAQMGVLKKWFGSDDSDNQKEALEKRRRRVDSQASAPGQDSSNYPG